MAQFIDTDGSAANTITEGTQAAAVAQRVIAARLERLPVTATHRKARIIVGLATFFDGFDALAIAFVMPVLTGLWHLTPAQTGFLISGAYVGQVFGAITFPWLSDRIGRIASTAWSAGLFGLASLLCAFAWNMPSLLIMRFVQGCGLGGEVPVASAYINEIARAPTRGRFFLMYEVAFPVGYVGAASLGLWLVPSFGWQSMFVVGAIPAIVAAIMRRVLPELPRWLAGKGRISEADAITTRMEEEARRAGATLVPPDVAVVPPVPPSRTRLRELFAPLYAQRTMVVWTLWFCQFFTTQAVNAWLPTLYKTQLHMTTSQALGYSFFNYGLGVVSLIVAALCFDYTGRRLWFAWALPMGSIPLFILAYIGIAHPVLVVLLATISTTFHGSCSAPLYVYTPELYPTRMRGFACGTAATARNIGASLSPTLVGLVLGSYGLSSVFIMLGTVPLIAAFMVFTFGIETKQRVLEEISP